MNEFQKTLETMHKIHDSKSHDYADPNNRFSNFDIAAYLMGQFVHDADKVFVCPIATKLARLATLLNSSDREPNNESIDDSLIDIANYVILWKCYRDRTKVNDILF